MNIRKVIDDYGRWILWWSIPGLPALGYAYQNPSVWIYALCVFGTFFFLLIFLFNLYERTRPSSNGEGKEQEG